MAALPAARPPHDPTAELAAAIVSGAASPATVASAATPAIAAGAAAAAAAAETDAYPLPLTPIMTVR
jgi:hypothetical protein